jgi:hypothetical protein
MVVSAAEVVPIGQWTFVAGVMDEATRAATLYAGSLTSPVAPVTSYEVQQTGTGSPSADAAYDLYVGSLQRSTASGFKGTIARAGVHGRVLTLGQLRRIQRTAWIERVRDAGPGCLLSADYLTGDATQRDHSGREHHGTVTSAIVAPHLPLSLLSVPRPVRVGPTGATNYTLSADAGTTTVTGVAAALKYGRKLAADAGTAVSTGVSAALEYGREIAATAGTAIASTVAATLLWARRLVGLDTAVDVTGTDATLSRTRVLTADAGDVTLTGVNATLTYSGNTGPTEEQKKKQFMLMGYRP